MKYRNIFYLAVVFSLWISHVYAMEGREGSDSARSGVQGQRPRRPNPEEKLRAYLARLPDEERKELGRLARENIAAAAEREEQRVEEAVRRVMALGPKGGGSASAAGAAEASSSTTEVH